MYYALIDGSRFYATASTLMMPQYKDRPVLVVSGRDGITIAANRACTKLHIKKFTGMWEVRDKVELHHGCFVRANFNTLGHLSKRMMSSIRHAVGFNLPYLEFSVDEIFVDLSSLHRIDVPLHEHLQSVRRQVYQETRLGTGVGIGRTIVLTKAGSFAAKNLPGYNGLCYLDSIKHEDKVLKQMPAAEVFGIGRRMTEHLKFQGIDTAYRLKCANPEKMRKQFSVNISNIVHELNGTRVLDINKNDLQGESDKKQIFSTASYRDRLDSADLVFSKIAYHIGQVGQKCRNQKSKIKELTVFIHTSRYDKVTPYHQQLNFAFEPPTSDTTILLKAIRDNADSLLPPDAPCPSIYKVGVGAVNLSNFSFEQFDLFHTQRDNALLMETIDFMNSHFGLGSLYFAAQSLSVPEKTSSTSIIELSNYLTRYSELPIIKCM
jgi:nucleotidyltransferase/DNA polymerase involved in DNA repair